MVNGHESVPDIYSDESRVTIAPYGVVIGFRRTMPDPVLPGQQQPAEAQVYVRLSLEHAKVLARQLAKILRQYEDGRLQGRIAVPPDVLVSLGISPDDWA